MYHYFIPIFISIPIILYSFKDELIDCCSRDYKKHKLSNQQLDNLIDKLIDSKKNI
jgi:hypothetical protein